MSRLYKHKISVQGSTPAPTSDRAITLSRLYKHKISTQGSTPNPTSEFFFSIGSIYVFIYLFSLYTVHCVWTHSSSWKSMAPWPFHQSNLKFQATATLTQAIYFRTNAIESLQKTKANMLN